MKLVNQRTCRAACAAALLACGVPTKQINAAVVTYNFDVNGSSQSPSNFGVVTGTTYDWDSATNGGYWSNNSTSTMGNIATNGWVQGNFPKFQPSGTPNYIVTVSNNEQITGAFFSTAQTVVLNPVGSGTLEAINTNAPNPPTIATADGFLGSSSADVTFNVPITGAGLIQFSNGGNLRLNAANSYTGGTNLASTSTLVHFNNGSAFGTNFINMGVAGLAPLLASGGATITLPNNFTSSVNGAGVNFAADANTPVISSGTWALGANNLGLRNNGVGASTVTLSNVISGTANITLSSNTSGTIIFSGANTYSGTTSITGVGGTGAGSTSVTLKLGAANTLGSTSQVIMSGGVLDPGGFNQAMSATLLVNINSTIDFSAGASELDFANSSGAAWAAGKTLNLANWSFGSTLMRFGTDATGLTGAQLAAITFNGTGAGTASLDANGYLVPEPASMLLLLSGSVLRRRRRIA